MLIRKTAYFDDFRCIASACPDSCCKEWDVLVDETSAAFYRSLPGKLGEDLRRVMHDEDGQTVMTITDGRCPMWRQDGLCRIQVELGEEALCRTCRDFPRLRHDYGDFVELTLELSCPEAARILLSAQAQPWVEQTVPGGEAPEYDEEAMDVLKATRSRALALVEDTARDVPSTLAALLLYGYQAQGELDGEEERSFDPDFALESVAEFAKPGDMRDILALYRDLEILTPQWEARLNTPDPGPWQEGYRNLARYFVERYWLQAVSDYDLAGRVKFMVVSCLVIRALGGNFGETAQLYSKEIENSTENVEALLDAAYESPAFTDDKLLGLLLNGG